MAASPAAVAAAAAVVAGKARLLALLAIALGGTAVGAGAGVTAYDLAGRYTHSFLNGNVDGDRYRTTDRVSIVAADRRQAYFDIELAFYNGHSCSLSGIATLEGPALVYREAVSRAQGGGTCELRIWRDGGRLRWTDGETGSCRSYCGARGSFTGGSMAWASRRPIPRAARTRIIRDIERNQDLP